MGRRDLMLKLVPFCALGMYGVSFGFYLQKITEKG